MKGLASTTCPVSASSACPSLDGVTTFCTWVDWGCAPEPACGGYFVIVDQAVDARFTYYYSAANGQFAATVQEAFGGGNATCLAGPSQFQPPTGCEPDTLADCAPPPRDGGIAFGASLGLIMHNPMRIGIGVAIGAVIGGALAYKKGGNA